MVRCTACGGPTIKLHYITRLIINIQLHSCLQHSLDIFWVLVNLRLGFFPSIVWCITGGQPRPLSVQIGTQWVWHGQSVIRCGLPRVPVHNADRRWFAFDNTSRQGTMQHQQTCRMATNKIIMPDEGGIQGCNCKCKGTESIQKRCPLPPRLWLDAFSLRKLIHNSQLLLVCPNNVWLVKEGVKLKAKVFTGRGNQQQAEHPMEITRIIYLRHNQRWCK